MLFLHEKYSIEFADFIIFLLFFYSGIVTTILKNFLSNNFSNHSFYHIIHEYTVTSSNLFNNKYSHNNY